MRGFPNLTNQGKRSVTGLLFALILTGCFNGQMNWYALDPSYYGGSSGNQLQRLALEDTTYIGTAGLPVSPHLTVKILDSNGAILSQGVTSISLNVYTDATCSSSSGSTGETVNSTNGVAVFNTLILQLAANYYIQASALNYSPSACVPLSIAPSSVDPTHSTLNASALTLVADGTSVSTLTVVLKDAYSNPVPGKSVNLTSSRGNQDHISTGSLVSDQSGAVTFIVSSASEGTAAFTAVDSSDSISISSGLSIQFTPGAVSPSVSTLSGAPSTLVADGVSISTLTVILKDGAGNPVSGKIVSLSSSRSTADVISPPSASTDASGIVTFTVRSTLAGSSTYTVTDLSDSTTLLPTFAVTFVSGPVSPSNSTFSATPSSVTADGVSTSTLTVVLKDSNGNPVSGKNVGLSTNRSSVDTITPSSLVTDSMGTAIFTVRSPSAGNSVYNATDLTDSLTLAPVPTVTFVPGSVSPTISSVASSSAFVFADGVQTMAVTVTLRDSNGNLIPGSNVVLSSSRTSSDTISGSGLTNASGMTIFQISSSQPGSSVFTASVNGASISQTASTHFYGNLQASSQVRSVPITIPADGSTQATITATLIDSTGTSIPGKTISLSSSRGSVDTLSPASGITTNSSGQAVFTFTSAKVGLPTLTATETTDDVTLSQTVQLNVLTSGFLPQTDYEAKVANSGLKPGDNSTPVSTWKDVSQSSSVNDGILNRFSPFSISSGWNGTGSLLTGSSSGPYRLVFDGTKDYVDFGSSMSNNTAFSFETWVLSNSPSSSGKIILQNSTSAISLSQSTSRPGLVTLAVDLPYSTQVLADSPTIYWKLDDTSNTQAFDSGPSHNNGSYFGSGTFSFSQLGLNLGSTASVLFPGSGNSMICSSVFQSPTSFSIEAWFKTTTTSGGEIIGFGSSQVGLSATSDRTIYMDDSGLLYFVVTYLGAESVITTSLPYNDGAPHHVVGTLSTSGMFLYVDGVSVPSSASISSADIYSGFWRVGGDQLSGFPGTISSNYFNGTLDEVAIYPTALTQTRVQAHYTAGFGCQSPSTYKGNTWNHLAATFDNQTLVSIFYVNGVQQCSQPYLAAPSGTPIAITDFIAGADSSNSAKYWSGNMAALRTYSTALTSAAIRANYSATASLYDIQKIGVQNPILWQRADAISGLSDGGSVSTWPDMSGAGNNLTASAPSQPVYKMNILKGYPVVRFNGTSSSMTGPSVFPVHADYTIIAAFIPSSFSANLNPLLGGSGETHFFGLGGTHLQIGHSGTYLTTNTPSTPFSAGTPYIVSATLSASAENASLFINGSSAATPSSITNSNSDSSIQVGSYSTNNFFSGDIAEILLFNSVLIPADRTLVEQYLNAKYTVY